MIKKNITLLDLDTVFDKLRQGNLVNIKIDSQYTWLEVVKVSDNQGINYVDLKPVNSSSSEVKCVEESKIICENKNLLYDLDVKGKKQLIEILGFKEYPKIERLNHNIQEWTKFFYWNKLLWIQTTKMTKIIDNEISVNSNTNRWIADSEYVIEMKPQNKTTVTKYSVKYIHSLQNFLTDNPNFGKIDFPKLLEIVEKK